MNEISSADMLAATRSVQAGRLTEATALLQRLLRGEPAGVPADSQDGPAGGFPRIIDVTPETVEVRERPAEQRTDPVPEALRRFLNRQRGVGPAQGAGRPATSPPLPDGARFLALSFSSEAGSRAYKLYVPSTARGEALPLVVMLHGCTQSPDDFAAGTRMNALAEEHGLLVAYPAQAASANMQRCWNWFRAEDQERGRGEPALIAGITRQIMRDHPVDPARVYVAGLSAGGAAAAIMGATYPDLYAAVGVHSGLAPGAASDMPSAFAAMQGRGVAKGPARGRERNKDAMQPVPTIVFHGDSDTTVHPRNGDAVVAQTGVAAAARVEEGRVPGGRSYRRSLLGETGDRSAVELWVVNGAGHAWSGGSSAGSYTDPQGPDASREMLRFFLEHPHAAPGAAPAS